MKKVFHLEHLDCANCAAKMETAIRKIPGVISANVSFMTQRLSLETPDDIFEQVLEQAVAVCRKVEPDCMIRR